MLTLFRRQTLAGKKRHGGKDLGRKYRRCDCPLHAEGHLLGVMHRRAFNTGNWNLAQKLIKEKEERGTWDAPADQKHAAIRKSLARPMTFYAPEEVAAMLKVEDATVLELIWLRQRRAIRNAGKCSNREIARTST